MALNDMAIEAAVMRIERSTFTSVPTCQVPRLVFSIVSSMAVTTYCFFSLSTFTTVRQQPSWAMLWSMASSSPNGTSRVKW